MDDPKLEEDKNKRKRKNKKVDCSQLPVEGKSTHELALARCNCLIVQYLDWKKKNHLRSDVARGITLIATATIPVLLLIPRENINILAATISAVAAIATGFLNAYGWQDNYIRYGYMWHALQTEKHRYLTHAENDYPADDEVKAAQNFARRIEQLVMEEVSDWQVAVQRAQQQANNPIGIPGGKNE